MSTTPIVHVVGLGPGDDRFLTAETTQLLEGSLPVRLRTSVHPAAPASHVSFDHLYEHAPSFEALYDSIVAELVDLATTHGAVVYAVPGSPMVAEHTVELLLRHTEITVQVHPAISVIDVACVALGIDPMTVGLRIADALTPSHVRNLFGPTLLLQVYSPEIAAVVGGLLDPSTSLTVLWHAGLPEARVWTCTAGDLHELDEADHLTSLYIPAPRSAAHATTALLELMARLRDECPWDQEQTHESLTRHLLEEAYEALDALEAYVAVVQRDDTTDADLEEASAHVEEELGDLLFQIVFHAHLGAEDQQFDFASIAQGVHDKLVFRHPHVFGDVTAVTSDDVAANWETLKKAEKGRASVTDGIATHLPALTLWAKLRRKASAVGLAPLAPDDTVRELRHALDALDFAVDPASDATATRGDESWTKLLVAVAELAQYAGVDAESVLRHAALELQVRIREAEGLR
jgi:tetrapyrrole methylase family protein/MazG family protein